MFFRKCKKCGGKLVLVDANIEVDIGGKTQKVKNVPAKQCTECRNLVVNEYVIERIKQYARDYPACLFYECENDGGTVKDYCGKTDE